MKHTTTTDLRKNLSAMMDAVNEDSEPMLVTRANGKPVVILSVEDYDALDETAYLLSTPANRKSLLASIAELDGGTSLEKSEADLSA